VTIEVALAPTERAPVVTGPSVSSPGATPVATALYRRSDLTTSVAGLADAWGRRWYDQLNEPGSASVVLQNDDPDLALVSTGDVVRFTLHGWAAFSMLVRDLNRVSIAENEEYAEVTTLSGPGLLAVLDEALVYPARGVGSRPFAEDRLFSWPSPEYNDTAWTPAAVMAINTAPFPPENEGWWESTEFPDPTAAWIWDPAYDFHTAPPGECYFRHTFHVDQACDAIVCATIDNGGELYLDGDLLIGDMGDFTNVYKKPTQLSVGPHTLAMRGENPNDPTVTNNPAAIIATIYEIDSHGIIGPVITNTNMGTWLGLYYPPTKPGMTPGEVLRIVTTEAKARGTLTEVTLAFNDVVDSEGVAWPLVGDIATKIGTDVLTFVRELTATYLDVWMEPAAFRLHAYVADGRGEPRAAVLHPPTDPHDPASGNLGGLTHRRVL
jgi:hypothetical protein